MMIVKASTSADNRVLKNLLQAYEGEFSLITKKIPSKEGVFPLDVDLRETDNFLLYEENVPIGFCVKGVSSERHDIYEFYIVPSKRGTKLGREFAKEIFRRYSGEWQVRQIEGANKAISFWRKAIGEFTNEKFEESIVDDEYWGKVTRQVFQS